MYEKTETFFNAIFEALPSMIIVVDADVRIKEYNKAAGKLITANKKTAFNMRFGEILHCVHSKEVPWGCGKSEYCKLCIVRNSVSQAITTNLAVSGNAVIEMERNQADTDVLIMFNAVPFSYENKAHALLIIDEVKELIS